MNMAMVQEPLAAIVRKRYSCRSYADRPITQADQQQLTDYLSSLKTGPLGTAVRFQLVAATEQDRSSLRGLGTYGFIKGAVGFMVGAAGPGERNLEDYGYTVELAVLEATALGLGTCWLGGSFTQSSFAKKIACQPHEVVPAVAAVGYPAPEARARDWSRRWVRADTRLPWGALFFREAFGNPLSAEQAGAYAAPLEMVRLAPSAKNNQPWRLVQDGNDFHFYLQRTQGYSPGSLEFKLFHMADLQRMDIGIAMCHFEQTARESGLPGQWVARDPGLSMPGASTSYVITWAG